MLKRIQLIISILILCIITGYYTPAFTQTVQEIQIQPVKLRDGFHVLYGGGGNISVFSGDDGILMIDTQFSQLLDKIKTEIKKISTKKIEYIFNTNWHYDHVSGNEPLSKEGCTIIAHTIARKNMQVEQYHPLLDTKVPVYPEAAFPQITFNDSFTLNYNNEEIHAFHIKNAHSDSDIVIHFPKTNVLHAGDIIFHRMLPFIDIYHGGSVDGLIKAVEDILEIINEDTKVVPGHGTVMEYSDVVEYKDMLITIRKRFKELIVGGKTFEEIRDLKITEKLYPELLQGQPSELFETIVYNSLTNNLEIKK